MVPLTTDRLGLFRVLMHVLHVTQTGQAILLAPSGLCAATAQSDSSQPPVAQLGRRWLLVQTRRRITEDGGASMLLTDP